MAHTYACPNCQENLLWGNNKAEAAGEYGYSHFLLKDNQIIATCLKCGTHCVIPDPSTKGAQHSPCEGIEGFWGLSGSSNLCTEPVTHIWVVGPYSNRNATGHVLMRPVCIKHYRALTGASKWSDEFPTPTRPCKGCGQTINDSDLVCQHCGDLKYAPELNPGIFWPGVIAAGVFGLIIGVPRGIFVLNSVSLVAIVIGLCALPWSELSLWLESRKIKRRVRARKPL